MTGAQVNGFGIIVFFAGCDNGIRSVLINRFNEFNVHPVKGRSGRIGPEEKIKGAAHVKRPACSL